MENLLIIPAPIRSHVIPSFSLAKTFSTKFNVNYLMDDDRLMALVKLQGYRVFYSTTLRFATGLDGLKLYDERKLSNNAIPLTDAIEFYLKNEIYKRRKAELWGIVEDLKPAIILIDVFSSSDFLVLYPHPRRLKFAFFCPMLSTHKVDGFPALWESEWGSSNPVRRNQSLSIARISTAFRRLLTGLDPSIQIYNIFLRNRIPFKYRICRRNRFVLSFRNVPELILAPLELEFSKLVKRDHQYYFGLCVSETRKDSEIDQKYEKERAKIATRKRNSKRIVFCSFGSFFTSLEHHKDMASFLLALIEALKDESGLFVVIAINQQIIDVVRSVIDVPAHFVFFSSVRQLEVLQLSDIYICHGGLGSIKEAIYARVPMLIFPLEEKYDNYGNALKIEYHGLGLRGDLRTAEPEEIHEKVTKVLTDAMYRKNINAFADSVSITYGSAELTKIVDSIEFVANRQ